MSLRPLSLRLLSLGLLSLGPIHNVLLNHLQLFDNRPEVHHPDDGGSSLTFYCRRSRRFLACSKVKSADGNLEYLSWRTKNPKLMTWLQQAIEPLVKKAEDLVRALAPKAYFKMEEHLKRAPSCRLPGSQCFTTFTVVSDYYCRDHM